MRATTHLKGDLFHCSHQSWLMLLIRCGCRNRTDELLVMSQARYRFSNPRYAQPENGGLVAREKSVPIASAKLQKKFDSSKSFGKFLI